MKPMLIIIAICLCAWSAADPPLETRTTAEQIAYWQEVAAQVQKRRAEQERELVVTLDYQAFVYLRLRTLTLNP